MKKTYGEYQLELEVIGADVSNIINQILASGINMYCLSYINDLTVRFKIQKRDYSRVLHISKRMGFSVRFIRLSGFSRWIKIIINRPVISISILILLILSISIPSRVFFISVQGNVNIPTNKIIEAAQDCGIGFGSSRRKVRSEKIKNLLLEKNPELQWVGINTSGCTAIISVVEKTQPQENVKSEHLVRSIVASRDGIIESYIVHKGNPLLDIGQAVTKGQVLVSGYTDCGIITKTTNAEAEIVAMTLREIEAIAPRQFAKRKSLLYKKVKYGFRFGKKIIYLYKDSGILDTTCVKMYSENILRLPGGFQLPVAIIKETMLYYSEEENIPVLNDSQVWLEDSAVEYLRNQMIAGEVISSQISVDHNSDATFLYGRYTCSEVIGQVKYEESIPKDE